MALQRLSIEPFWYIFQHTSLYFSQICFPTTTIYNTLFNVTERVVNHQTKQTTIHNHASWKGRPIKSSSPDWKSPTNNGRTRYASTFCNYHSAGNSRWPFVKYTPTFVWKVFIAPCLGIFVFICQSATAARAFFASAAPAEKLFDNYECYEY